MRHDPFFGNRKIEDRVMSEGRPVKVAPSNVHVALDLGHFLRALGIPLDIVPHGLTLVVDWSNPTPRLARCGCPVSAPAVADRQSAAQLACAVKFRFPCSHRTRFHWNLLRHHL